MSDIFISYARSTAAQAQAVAEALRALGYSVWRDDDLPTHRAYADVIEEQLGSAKAVVVIWSAEAVKSQWVRSEADRARGENKLVQLAVDGSRLPMPFDQIQCADLSGWAGQDGTPGWRKVAASVAALVGSLATSASVEDADRPLPVPAARPPDLHPNNLPRRRGALIGREAEMIQLVELLGAADLVTVTGTGGVGKTRIVIEIGLSQLDHYEDGVWLAELAPVSDPSQVASAVARAMSIELPPGQDSVGALVDRLRLRQCLIILDNCEHVIDAVAALAESVLEQSSEVKLLTSSQELLGVEGEQVFRLRSLGEPDAAALFTERAHGADARFKITAQNRSAVAAICRRLDGIPLAIEMAAARAPSLGCDGVLERLDDRFRVLTGGRRTALPRQRTLHATLDWSHGLLSGGDAAVFRRLSVFSGGFSLEAASEVADDDQIDRFQVIDALSSLVAKSLVVADLLADRVRYRLLETTRAYALEQLAAVEETTATQRRHAECFLKFAAPARADYFGSVSDDAFAERYFAEMDNIERALDWAFSAGGDTELGIALTATTYVLWAAQPLYPEYIRWLEIAVAKLGEATPSFMRAKLLAANTSALMMNFPIRALEVADEAIAACRDECDPMQLAEVLNAKAFSLWFVLRVAEMAALSAESSGLIDGLRPSRLTAQTQVLAGYVRLVEQDSGAAKSLFEAVARDLCSFGADGLANFFTATGKLSIDSLATGSPDPEAAISVWGDLLNRVRATDMLAGLTIGISATELAWNLAKRAAPGDLNEALGVSRKYFKAAPSSWQRNMLTPLALIALRSGRTRDGAKLAGLAEALNAQAGTIALVQSRYDELSALMRAELSDDELERLRADGARMSLDQAVRLAWGGE